jgi:hypothetical protein
LLTPSAAAPANAASVRRRSIDMAKTPRPVQHWRCALRKRLFPRQAIISSLR